MSWNYLATGGYCHLVVICDNIVVKQPHLAESHGTIWLPVDTATWWSSEIILSLINPHLEECHGTIWLPVDTTIWWSSVISLNNLIWWNIRYVLYDAARGLR